MLIAESNLKLLSAVLVLLWPLSVVFPVAAVKNRHLQNGVDRQTYFMISLSLMIFLISAIKMELTHTMNDVSFAILGRIGIY